MIRTTVFFDKETRARQRKVAASPQGLAPGVGEFRSGSARTASRSRKFLAAAAKDDSWRRR